MDIDGVRKAAKNSGYRIGHLAEVIGINRSTLSRFVNGKAGLGKKKIAKLLETLNLDPETLKKKAS